MFTDPFLTQMVVKERAQDLLHQAESARLIRKARGSQERRTRRAGILAAFRSLVEIRSRPDPAERRCLPNGSGAIPVCRECRQTSVC
jgi:hypothetical protein